MNAIYFTLEDRMSDIALLSQALQAEQKKSSR